MEEILSPIPATEALFLFRAVGLRRLVFCSRTTLALSIMVNTLLFRMGGAMCAFLLAPGFI